MGTHCASIDERHTPTWRVRLRSFRVRGATHAVRCVCACVSVLAPVTIVPPLDTTDRLYVARPLSQGGHPRLGKDSDGVKQFLYPKMYV